MDIVTIDFETYYDSDYSLSKLTTEEYIRSSLFEVIGVSVKVNNYSADWYSGDDPGGFLQSLDYSDKAILCHNTAFDGAILAWKYGIKPKFWLDTLSMARPLHAMTTGCSLAKLAQHYNLGEKGTEVITAKGMRRKDFSASELAAYGSYCCNDVELTWKLFHKLKKQVPAQELLSIDQIIRMYTEPTIRLNRDLLVWYLTKLRQEKQELLARVSVTADVLSSNEKFAQELIALGVDPPRKVSLKTNKETYAFAKTDKEFIALQDHPDLAVQTLVAARLGVKSTIAETRTESLISVAERGLLPIMLNYYGAHTGRLSGGDGLNLQNFPARTGDATLRQSLLAPLGSIFVSADSSQIEARIVAWLAGQTDLLEAFREGRDVYSEFASELYGRKITKADKEERFCGKCAILSLGYGAGAAKFREMLRIQGGVVIDEMEAKRIVAIYRAKYFKIPQLWRRANNALNKILCGEVGEINPVVTYDDNGIRLPNKMYLRYPSLQMEGNGFVYKNNPRSDTADIKIYGGKVTENICQALAAIVIRDQMLAVGRQYKVAFQVHDEIILCVPETQADAARTALVTAMNTPPMWAPELPVTCESGIGVNYDIRKS